MEIVLLCWKSEKNQPVEVLSILFPRILHLFSSLHYHTVNFETLLNTVDCPLYFSDTKNPLCWCRCVKRMISFLLNLSYLSLRLNSIFCNFIPFIRSIFASRIKLKKVTLKIDFLQDIFCENNNLGQCSFFN
jgi:hypothetical protein